MVKKYCDMWWLLLPMLGRVLKPRAGNFDSADETRRESRDKVGPKQWCEEHRAKRLLLDLLGSF